MGKNPKHNKRPYSKRQIKKKKQLFKKHFDMIDESKDNIKFIIRNYHYECHACDKNCEFDTVMFDAHPNDPSITKKYQKCKDHNNWVYMEEKSGQMGYHVCCNCKNKWYDVCTEIVTCPKCNRKQGGKQ